MDNTGEKIKLILETKRRNQAEMSRIAGISTQTMSSIINGKSKPNWEFLAKLNQELDVNLNWLIADDGEPFKTAQFEQVKNDFTQRVREILKQEGLIK